MKLKRRSAKRCATLSGVPLRKLSRQMTSSPSARKRSQRCEPMKPAPPVTRMRAIADWLGGAYDRAPDGEVGEAVLAHDLGLVEVAAVEDDRAAEEPLHAREVRPAELVPLGHDEERVGAGEGLVVDAMVGDALAEDLARLVQRLGVVAGDGGA